MGFNLKGVQFNEMYFGATRVCLFAVLLLAMSPISHAQNRSPAMNEARQRLQHLFDHQNGAESSWRNHRQLLRERPASATEGAGASIGAAIGGESGSLVRARELGVQARQCIAGVQALVDALPTTTAQLPSTITAQFTRCEGFITQENALFERYRDESQSAGAVGAFVSAVPVQTMEALQRIGQFYLRGFARMAGAPTQTPESQPSFANRSRLMPDAEDTMLASANNDLQRWAGQRAQNILRGRRGPAALPPLYVPNYVPYLIESEFIRTRGTTAAQRNEAVLLWQSRLEHYRSIAASTTDPMARIRRVLAEASRDFLEPYHRGDRSMLAALQGRGVNCEGRARFLYGVMSALNLELPAGWSLGVQLFPIHMELVLHNPRVQPPVIRLFGQTRNGMSGPIYHPALLLKDLIAQRSEAAPDYVNNSDLLMAASDRPAPGPVSRTRAFLDQVRNLRSLTSRDGLGSTLPLPEAGEGDITEIPEYSLSPAPDPDRPMPVELPPLQANAAPANGREEPNGARPRARLEIENEDVNLGRPVTAEQMRAQRPPAVNPLRTDEDVNQFCEDISEAYSIYYSQRERSDPRVAAADVDRIRQRFLRLLYLRIPAMAQIQNDPEVVLRQDNASEGIRRFLSSITRLNGTSTCLFELFPADSPAVQALSRLHVDYARQGRWHDVASLLSYGFQLNTEYTLYHSIPSDRVEVMLGSPPIVSPPASRGTQNPSVAQNRPGPAPFHGPFMLAGIQGQDAGNNSEESSRNMRISFDDAVQISSVQPYARFAFEPGIFRAICSAAPNRVIALWGRYFSGIKDSRLPVFWDYKIADRTELLRQCQSQIIFDELYNQIRDYLPYSSHCDANHSLSNPGYAALLNALLDLINSRLTGGRRLPRLNPNECAGTRVRNASPAQPRQGTAAPAETN